MVKSRIQEAAGTLTGHDDPDLGHPPNGDDPWMQETAQFMRRCRSGWSEGTSTPTAGQRVIAEACALHGNPVHLAILQARLLANETYADIERHSGIPASVVEAYQQLFFNVTDQTCLDRFLYDLVRPDRLVLRLVQKRDIGSFLLMLARAEGAAGVEAAAMLLARLDGQTFTDGLPAEHTSDSRWERSRRLVLIGGLGLFKRKQLKQLQSLMGVMPNVALAISAAADAMLPLWDELLSQVRVPKEIRQYAKAEERWATAQAAGQCDGGLSPPIKSTSCWRRSWIRTGAWKSTTAARR